MSLYHHLHDKLHLLQMSYLHLPELPDTGGSISDLSHSKSGLHFFPLIQPLKKQYWNHCTLHPFPRRSLLLHLPHSEVLWFPHPGYTSTDTGSCTSFHPAFQVLLGLSFPLQKPADGMWSSILHLLLCHLLQILSVHHLYSQNRSCQRRHSLLTEWSPVPLHPVPLLIHWSWTLQSQLRWTLLLLPDSP